MVATARVIVNNGNSGVTGQTDNKVSTEMLKELKNIGFSLKKMFSTGASGIASMFGAGAAGGTTALAGGVLAGSTVAAANEFSKWNFGQSGAQYGYEEAMIEGEEKVLKINQQTGEIIDVLTQQEARDQGILNEKDDIYENLKVSSAVYKENVKHLEHQKEKLIISADDLATISDLQGREKEIQREINDALTRKLKSLNGNAPASGPSNSYSSEMGIGYNSAGMGYSAAVQNGWTQEQERQKQDSIERTMEKFNDPLAVYKK